MFGHHDADPLIHRFFGFLSGKLKVAFLASPASPAQSQTPLFRLGLFDSAPPKRISWSTLKGTCEEGLAPFDVFGTPGFGRFKGKTITSKQTVSWPGTKLFG